MFAELVVDRGDIVFYSSLADKEDRGDLRIRASFGNQAAYLFFPVSHAIVIQIDRV